MLSNISAMDIADTASAKFRDFERYGRHYFLHFATLFDLSCGGKRALLLTFGAHDRRKPFGGYADDVVSGDLLEAGARLPLLAYKFNLPVPRDG
jgi:hypothetical protein